MPRSKGSKNKLPHGTAEKRDYMLGKAEVQTWVDPALKDAFARLARVSGRTMRDAAGEAIALWVARQLYVEALEAQELATQEHAKRAWEIYARADPLAGLKAEDGAAVR